MARSLDTIKIKNFRSFDSLSIEGLGDVTLITGRNNTGKSTLLEAIRILVTDGAPSTFFNILNYREEADGRSEDPVTPVLPEDYASLCSLFAKFPTLAGCTEPFVIEAKNSTLKTALSLKASIEWFNEELDPSKGVRRMVQSSRDLFGEDAGFPALQIELPHRKRYIRIDRPLRAIHRIDLQEPGLAPCVFIDPFSSRSTAHLGALWDAIALTEAEHEIVKSLQIVAPEIKAVSMIGGESRMRIRTAIAKSDAYSHPVSLRSFGDGVNRLFGLILSLVNARNGVLLVDEIENGLHYSILPEVWDCIFRLARDLNVQVFATSHSWDCVEAFQKAASKDQKIGVLVRLTRKDAQVIPTVFGEKELEIATREHIELR